MRNPKTKTVERGSDTETFAAQVYDLNETVDRKHLRAVLTKGRREAARPWKWYGAIGEIHYAVSRGAKIAGYAQLNVHRLNADGTVGKKVTNGLPGEIGRRLQSPYGGQRALCDRFFTLAKIPGDSYLVRVRDEKTGEIEGYDFISSREIATDSLTSGGSDNDVFEPNQPIKRITLPGAPGASQQTRDIAAGDFLGRVWRAGLEYVDIADSPMKALETNCELLHLLTINLKSKLMSRLALNGIFFIPNQITEAVTSAPTPDDQHVFHSNKVLDSVIRAASFAIANFDDPSAALPIIMTGDGAYGKMIQHIILDREIYQTDMDLRHELINRILMGLDVQPQHVRGLGDSNHWSAWAVSDEEARVNVRPDLETMCWALTRCVLWREMQDEGRKPGDIENYVVWYDLTPANVRTNQAEDSRQLVDRNLIGPGAARRMNGVAEVDAPSEEEYIRQFGQEIGDPYLATWGLAANPTKNGKIDFTKITAGGGKTGPNAATPADKPQVSPSKGNPGSPDDAKNNGPKRLRPAS